MRVFPVAWQAPGRLAVVSRPSPASLDVELRVLAGTGVGTLVSLLSATEVTELGLAAESEAAARAGLAFLNHPVPDFGIPGETFRRFAFELHDEFRAGASIAAHCRASVGRSPLLIASIMVLDGASPEDAWRRISEARGVPVPDTGAQRQWIRSLPSRR